MCACAHSRTAPRAGASKGISSPGTRVTGGCEFPAGVPNVGPLQEQRVLLTVQPSPVPSFLPSLKVIRGVQCVAHILMCVGAPTGALSLP